MSARLIWRFVFLGHSILFAIAWWILPGGFPVSQLKFWCNQIACPGLALVMGLGCFADRRDRHALLGPLASGAGMLSVGGGLSAAIVFSASMLGFGIFTSAAGVLMMIVAARNFEGTHRLLRSASAAGFALVGPLLVLAQRGPEPTTRPVLAKLDQEIAWRTQEPNWRFASAALGVVAVDARREGVRIERDRYRLRVDPLLTFASRSVDRGWTIFATDRDRRGPSRHFLASESKPLSFVAEYGPPERAMLSVTVAGPSLEAEGQVAFDAPVYSHLNSYSTVQLVGHTSLELEFSPCPGHYVEPLPHDYPVGRPLRMASLDRSGRFLIVEAASAEKGPFRTLAEGTLERGDPLTITLRDEGSAIVAVTFEDWSAQISTELSPTAGWGMPQNGITFARHTSDRASVVALELTLASTSAGRGFDSVGHAAGVYRSRIRLEWLGDAL